MRVRVMLDVTTPLQIDQKVRQPGGDWLRGKFRYEKLPTFCFLCGRIGHIERHCGLYYRAPNSELLVRKWDASLRAKPRKQVVNGRTQWLVPAPDNSNIGGSGFGRPPLQSMSLNTPGFGRNVSWSTMALKQNLGVSLWRLMRLLRVTNKCRYCSEGSSRYASTQT
ncbi:hypothetical protein LINGRAHAP2_LOCUS3784 [Linum grandiflorum]